MGHECTCKSSTIFGFGPDAVGSDRRFVFLEPASTWTSLQSSNIDVELAFIEICFKSGPNNSTYWCESFVPRPTRLPLTVNVLADDPMHEALLH